MSRTRLIIIGLLILLLDQYTKLLAEHYLEQGEPVPVIQGLFNLTLVYNKGAAFGLFGGWPDFERRAALVTVSLVAIAVVCRFVLHEARADRWSQLALAGIVAGALGNVIDRIRIDAVVDFLDFYWRGSHWPAFNVADSAICVGVFVLILRTFRATNPSQHVEIPAIKSR